MSLKLLDDAVASALCPMFQALVPATSTIAVAAPFLGPKGMAVSMVSASVANLSMLGASATCPEVEIGPDPPSTECGPVEGCIELSSGTGSVYQVLSDGSKVLTYGQLTGYKLTYSEEAPDLNGDYYLADIQLSQGGPYNREAVPWLLIRGGHYEMELNANAVCGKSCGSIASNPPVPDHTYVDQSTNCTYNVKFEGFIQETPGAAIQPVFEVSSAQSERADGSRMGGCNLSPTIVVGGPNGPGGPGGPTIPPIPVPPIPPIGPDDAVPWWAAPLLGGATAAGLNLVGQAIDDMLAPRLPEGSFTLTAPCDTNDKGEPLEQSWIYPEQKVEERMIAHQITMLEALQTHLNWKTPICGNERPPKEGQWVTTRWISDEKMDHSDRRLRKLFRYRTKSTRDLGQLSTYWKDFVWTAGDVCVVHKGAWWGNPQVWASTEKEGQRVIRHAATEAGLDPDQDGEWSFSGSNSPRYGMSGTMRIQMHKGFPWVAKREGAEWPNVLALQGDP